MVSLRTALSRVLLGLALCVPTAAVFVPTDASASVSIAIAYDALVQDADVVAVITPGESKSVWEEGRIVTYTQVHVDQGVAGDVGPGSDGWVRTRGGVVGKIGQMVDGEPVLEGGKSTLLFLRRFNTNGVFEVSARAQGQYPILLDAVTKKRKIIRSTSVGVLLPPKPVYGPPAPPVSGGVQPQSAGGAKAIEQAKVARLAQEVLNDRPLDDVTREISTAWKRLHPAK